MVAEVLVFQVSSKQDAPAMLCVKRSTCFNSNIYTVCRQIAEIDYN